MAFILALIGFCYMTAESQSKKMLLRKITIAQAKAAARQEHKLIFIAVGTSWCGPCKNMEKMVFTNDSVADYYNTNFVCMKLDLEKGEGIALGERFEIRSVPTYLFLDSTEQLVYKMKSAMSAGEFLACGKTANNPEKNLTYYQHHFSEKKDNLRFLEEYLDILMVAGMTSEEAVKAYFSLQKDDLISEKNWNILKAHARDIFSDEFATMMVNRKAFSARISPGEVTEVLDSRIRKAFEDIIFFTDTFKMADFTRARNRVAALNYENGDKLIFEADLQTALKTGNWDLYATLCLENAEFYYLGKPRELSELAEIAFHLDEHFGPGKILDKAEFWAKSEVEHNPYYFTYVTYAQILYKNNKNEEALTFANKAKAEAVKNKDKSCIAIADDLLKKIYKKKYAMTKSG